MPQVDGRLMLVQVQLYLLNLAHICCQISAAPR
ncbi:hypothetical protein ACVWYU_002504 [Pseudomonas sp. TE12234]